jgi:hypothetical protein
MQTVIYFIISKVNSIKLYFSAMEKNSGLNPVKSLSASTKRLLFWGSAIAIAGAITYALFPRRKPRILKRATIMGDLPKLTENTKVPIKIDVKPDGTYFEETIVSVYLRGVQEQLMPDYYQNMVQWRQNRRKHFDDVMKYLEEAMPFSQARLPLLEKTLNASLNQYLEKNKCQNCITDDLKRRISTLPNLVIPHKELTFEQYVEAITTTTAQFEAEFEDIQNRDLSVYEQIVSQYNFEFIMDFILHRVEDRVYEELGIEIEDISTYTEAHKEEVLAKPEFVEVLEEQRGQIVKILKYLHELSKQAI